MHHTKKYELTNHLGNVLTVISDRKIAVSLAGSPTVVDHFSSEILSASDFYCFGATMNGRKYTSSSSYRYGFNGKENDNEVKGEGNSVDFGARIYDSRLGRFLSIDPEYKSFPQHSNYSFAANTPICAIDVDGRRVYIITSNGEYNNCVDQRKSEIESMKGFDPTKDHVYVIEVQDLSKLKNLVKDVVKDAMGNGYGGTVEFDWYGHGGSDGPIADVNTGPNTVADCKGQMNAEGWNEIDFNFDSKCSIANFYGCRMSGFAARFVSYQDCQFASGYGGQCGDTDNPNSFEQSFNGEFLHDGAGLFIFQNPGFDAHRLENVNPDNPDIPVHTTYLSGSNDNDWYNHQSQLSGKQVSGGKISTNATVSKDNKNGIVNISGYKKK